MTRFILIVVAALLTTACSGLSVVLPFADRSSGAHLDFEEGTTETSQGILAFDPEQHKSLDIAISMPASQDDVDVFIVSSNGIRFQVLGSFQNCHVEGDSRLCQRELPLLPDEGIDNWRVEAVRVDPSDAGSVTVDVTWVAKTTTQG